MSFLALIERGKVISQTGDALYSKLPHDIAARELKVIGKKLSIGENDLTARKISQSPGPGNMVAVTLKSEHVTEVFTAFGRRGVRAERVADQACQQALEYLSAGVPVGIHLADQLLIPLALAGGGRYRTLQPDQHTLTNIDVIRQFMDISIEVKQESDAVWEIIVEG